MMLVINFTIKFYNFNVFSIFKDKEFYFSLVCMFCCYIYNQIIIINI